MGMTIDELIQGIQIIKAQAEWDYPLDWQIVLDGTIEIMRKYQELEQEQSFKWCTDCKEYDQEKHCCHRFSKVIRDTVEEMKQEYIEREALDKIRAQIKSHLRGVEITLEVLVENDPLRPKMEGAKDTLEECLNLIDKAEAEAEHD